MKILQKGAFIVSLLILTTYFNEQPVFGYSWSEKVFPAGSEIKVVCRDGNEDIYVAGKGLLAVYHGGIWRDIELPGHVRAVNGIAVTVNKVFILTGTGIYMKDKMCDSGTWELLCESDGILGIDTNDRQQDSIISWEDKKISSLGLSGGKT